MQQVSAVILCIDFMYRFFFLVLYCTLTYLVPVSDMNKGSFSSQRYNRYRYQVLQFLFGAHA